MTALAHRIMLSSGWRRMALALLAGAVAALAMPPLNVVVALLLSFPVAVWLLDGASERGAGSLRTAALIGWCFGFGYFLAGLWWLGAAFLVQNEDFLWLMPLGVIGLPAFLALFHAFGFMLARALWSPGPWRILAFVAGLSAAEWLRGNILTGFPWNAFGQAFGAFDVTAQAASLGGLDFLTVLVLFIFAAPAVLATGTGWRGRGGMPLAALLVLAAILVFGTGRLAGARDAFAPGVKIRIVQPNISERQKIKPGGGVATLNEYLALSDRATAPGAGGIADVTHLVWPESAFPFILSREPRALAEIGAFLPPTTTLITGAARMEPPLAGHARPRFFNALQVVNGDGLIVESYDKVHLVPFGEYLPAESLLQSLGLRQFVEVPGDFEAGPKHRLLDVAGLPPVLPLICYEAIFPTEITRGTGRPGVMINVTNDAWFGETFGPYQHFQEARLRAVEQGVPMIRAANSGISGVVDAWGRVLQQTTLGTQAVLDVRLPQALAPTVFARFGEAGFILPLAGAFLLALTARMRS